MPGYKFNPTAIGFLSPYGDDSDGENRIDMAAEEATAAQQHGEILQTQLKQLKLLELWDKQNSLLFMICLYFPQYFVVIDRK